MNTIHKKAFYEIRKRLLGALPESLRQPLLRNMIQLDLTSSPDVVFKLAETKDELEGAFALLHDAYVSSGFMKKDPSGLRITPYHALPTTSTLIAKSHDRIIATVSLIRDNPFGLPLQTIFHLDELKQPGLKFVEISSLAIHRDFRGRQGLLFLLCKFLYEYCIKYFAVDFMVIAVNPSFKDLYETIMLFEKLSEKEVKSYSFANNAPAIGQFMDLRQAHNKLMSVYLHKPLSKNLFAFMMQSQSPLSFKFPDRAYYNVADPVMTPEFFDYFFNQKTQVFKNLTPFQIETLHMIYAHSPAHLRMLPPLMSSPLNKKLHSRFPTQCAGRLETGINQRVISLRVIDVSQKGFLAVFKEKLEPSETEFVVHISISPLQVVTVTAQCAWINKKGQGGFRILRHTPEWENFIQHLYNDIVQFTAHSEREKKSG